VSIFFLPLNHQVTNPPGGSQNGIGNVIRLILKNIHFIDMLAHIKSNKSNYIVLSVLLFMLVLPNVFLAFHGSDFDSSGIPKKAAYILLSFVLLAFPLAFLRPKVFLIIGIIYAFIAPFELAVLFIYRSPINSGIIDAIIGTTTSEAMELLRGIIPFTVLGLLYIALFIVAVIKFVPYSFKLLKTYKLIILAAFVITLCSMWVCNLRISYYIVPNASASVILDLGTSSFVNKFTKIFPYSAITEINKTIASNLKMKKYMKDLNNFRFFSFKKDTLSCNEKYVLVIGETSRSQNYELYGYRRGTNPELKKVKNLIVLTDFAADANLTSICFPLIFTRAIPDSFDISYKEKTIIGAFKECGFKTYWISNQDIFINELTRLKIDVDRLYQLKSRFDFSGNFDEDIFTYLNSILKRDEKKQFIVINLMGSHFRYNFRYPPGFNVFKPGLEGAFDYMMISAGNKDRLINIYDNSILYTDHIVSEIIRRLDATKSVSLMMYFSDHGENLFDGTDGKVLHGTEGPTKYEIIIPFLVWHSQKYDSVYIDKIKNLAKNKDKRLNTSNFFYSMLDASNISYKNVRNGKSFFNDSFREDSVRKVLTPQKKVLIYDRK
jgi:glucan phosphoethanolaminetransferase (alkaline phosphatase superfamily)